MPPRKSFWVYTFRHSYFEEYKRVNPDIPEEVLKKIEDSTDDIVERMQLANDYADKHPVQQPPEGEFDFNQNPYDDYDELRTKLVEFIPDFNMRLKFNAASGRFDFSADIHVFILHKKGHSRFFVKDGVIS